MTAVRIWISTLLLLLVNSLQLGSIAQAADSPETQCNPWFEPAEFGGSSVSRVLADMPLTTRWVDVPDSVRQQLKDDADNRLAAFRARWGKAALAIKQDILLRCPTLEMSEAVDDYYRKSYDTVVPQTFSLKNIRNAYFSRALARNYLGTMAAERASLTYPDAKVAEPRLGWKVPIRFRPATRRRDVCRYQSVSCRPG